MDDEIERAMIGVNVTGSNSPKWMLYCHKNLYILGKFEQIQNSMQPQMVTPVEFFLLFHPWVVLFEKQNDFIPRLSVIMTCCSVKHTKY